jgi:hypothetical protein
MTAIDRTQFAGECITQAVDLGAWAHYMVAVAQLRSKIDDAVKDDKFGPFMLTKEKWGKFRTEPDVGLTEDDIKSWDMQCLLFAFWTHQAHQGLVSSTGQNPNAEEIYTNQFPGESAAGLNQAFIDTRDLMPGGQTVADANTNLPVKQPAT